MKTFDRRRFLKGLLLSTIAVPAAAVGLAAGSEPENVRGSIVVHPGAEDVVITGNVLDGGGNIVIHGGTKRTTVTNTLLKADRRKEEASWRYSSLAVSPRPK